MRRVLIAFLKGYKLCVSPLLPSACRFYPTCSEYMMEAIEMHGAGRGAWMGLRRLLRCHPFHKGGYDPVDRPARTRCRRPELSELSFETCTPLPVI